MVVQRSRAYAKASQIQETGDAAVFPQREDPKVAEYSIRKSYGKLLDLVDSAFQKDKPLFALPMYYPLAYYEGPDTSIDPLEWNRQAQVVGLIRTNFLKRFESSVYAFELSCDRLLRKLLAFVDVNSETASERKRYERWTQQHEEMLTQARVRRLTFWGSDEEPEEENEDIVPPELLEKATRLPRDEYDVPEILAETYLDLDQIATLLDESRSFEPSHDDKLKKLVSLLKSKEMTDRKVLIFTEFADTARYLLRELEKAGIKGVAQLDSSTKTNRADAIRRFAPYYNGLTSAELAARGQPETQVLIATDVLSEGLNLQDATRLVNYDIHWNPVRLMQRIGRVDRRLNPDVEAQLITNHSELAKQRGQIAFWNFLPPDDLDTLLRLYGKVSHKTLLISKTLGIEGKKLLKPSDDFDALKEFNSSYEGETTVQEQLHLEYQKLLDEHEARLAGLPRAIFSGRERAAEGSAGVFFCFRLPALDTESGEFTLEAGVTRWYLHTLPGGELFDDPRQIAHSVRSAPGTPRTCNTDRPLPGGLLDVVEVARCGVGWTVEVVERAQREAQLVRRFTGWWFALVGAVVGHRSGRVVAPSDSRLSTLAPRCDPPRCGRVDLRAPDGRNGIPPRCRSLLPQRVHRRQRDLVMRAGLAVFEQALADPPDDHRSRHAEQEGCVPGRDSLLIFEHQLDEASLIPRDRDLGAVGAPNSGGCRSL